MDGYVTIGTKIDTSGVDKDLSKLGTDLEKKGKNYGSKFGVGFMVGFSIINSVVSKFLQGFINSMDDAIKRVDTLNNFPRVMGNLGQSTEDAQQSIDYLSEKLTGLPTKLDDAVSGVQRLTAVNNNVKASTEMWLAMNNAILAGGANMQTQQSALEQLAQAYSKGKPDMQDWKAMMQAMPAQLNQAAQVMGFGENGAQKLGKALRDGSVSMNDFMLTLVDMNKNGGPNFASLEKQAREGTGGIQTQIANLKTAFARGMAEILQVIGQTNIANFFNSIIGAIKTVVPYIGAFIRSMMVAVSVVGKVLGTIGRAIGSLFGSKGGGKTKEFKADLDKSAFSMKNIGSGAGTANKNLGKAAKQAKEMKKQLAGFDEMNVLQDNKQASTGGGGGADAGGVGDIGDIGGLDNFNLGLDNIKKKIAEITPLMKIFTALVWGLMGAFLAFKIGTFLADIGAISATITTIMKVAGGIGLIIAGIVLVIQGIIGYLNDPTWQNFLLILAGIASIVAGLFVVLTALGIAAAGTIAIVAGIVLVIGAIALAVYKNWDKVKAILLKVGNWIMQNVINPVVDFFTGLWEAIVAIFTPIIDFFKGLWEIIKAFWTPIFQTVIDIIKGLVATIISIVKTIWDNIKIILNNLKQIATLVYNYVIKPVADALGKFINDRITKIKAFITLIKNLLSPLVNFISGILNKIRDIAVKIGSKVGGAIGGALKGAVNVVLSVIQGILNTPINAINALIGTVNKLPGVSLTKLKTFKFPRLAKGGIVNLPGSGVPIGGAIAGERGAEGVIPLTDSQQMALLGEAIGRYITVNANITNNMNGRVISRELQKIQNDNNFAYNR